MAGKTPAAAIDAYLRPLRQTIRCVCAQHYAYLYRGQPDDSGLYALVLNRGYPVPLRGQDGRRLLFHVRQQFRVVEAEIPGSPYKVTTAAYLYGIETPEASEVISFHWNPHGLGKVTTPHVHLGPAVVHPDALARDLHIPTGRVSLESVVRFPITELGVIPQLPDWEDMLLHNEELFNLWRTW